MLFYKVFVLKNNRQEWKSYDMRVLEYSSCVVVWEWVYVILL